VAAGEHLPGEGGVQPLSGVPYDVAFWHGSSVPEAADNAAVSGSPAAGLVPPVAVGGVAVAVAGPALVRPALALPGAVLAGAVLASAAAGVPVGGGRPVVAVVGGVL